MLGSGTGCGPGSADKCRGKQGPPAPGRGVLVWCVMACALYAVPRPGIAHRNASGMMIAEGLRPAVAMVIGGANCVRNSWRVSHCVVIARLLASSPLPLRLITSSPSAMAGPTTSATSSRCANHATAKRRPPGGRGIKSLPGSLCGPLGGSRAHRRELKGGGYGH